MHSFAPRFHTYLDLLAGGRLTHLFREQSAVTGDRSARVCGGRGLLLLALLPAATAYAQSGPAPCAMSVPLNTPTTLDLATCLAAGFAPTGVSVVATPAHGAAAANGTRVTYTPVRNYFGADTFTFVASSAGGTSPQGVVKVTVTGRPDPTQDTTVAALVAAQSQAAQRFSKAQITNVQRRMESLHRSQGASAAASGALQARTADLPGAISPWVEGVAGFGTRDADGAFGSSEFRSDGITVGVDRRYSDRLAVGLGLGYSRDTTRIGSEGSVNRSKGYSLAAYGSYQPGPTTFVDGLLGIGSLDFDSTRFVAPVSASAFGRRSGTQVFGALTGGYELRSQNLLLSPYARLDFSTDRLRSSSESGAGAFALTYLGQTSTSVQGAVGVRGESVVATRFGFSVPKVRAEYRHDFQGAGQARIGYADQPDGPRYTLASARGGRNSIVLGIGGDLLFRDGLTLSLEYQLDHSFSSASGHALRLRLSKDFDVRGLPKLLQGLEVRTGEPLDVQVDAGFTRDDNVTRAKAGPDKLSDGAYSVNISKTIQQELTEQSRIVLTGSLGGEKFHRYNGLSRVTGSVDAEYQYRNSSEFGDPTLGVFAKLTGEAYETSLRDGHRVSVGLSIRQPLTDRINLFGALAHNRREAQSAVFSTRDNSVRGNVDYALSNDETIYVGAEYRRGDIVSTGRPSLENASIAKVTVQDDAYAGGQLFSYKLEGRTVLATIGYNLNFGANDSLDFSWRHVRSTPGLRPAFVTSPRNYKANQLSVVYLLRF
jgi:uncharacterized protein YhjY with autotransporter beta-barrel domain